jgi:hypothetical protein
MKYLVVYVAGEVRGKEAAVYSNSVPRTRPERRHDTPKAHVKAEHVVFRGFHQLVLAVVLVVVDREVDDVRPPRRALITGNLGSSGRAL